MIELVNNDFKQLLPNIFNIFNKTEESISMTREMEDIKKNKLLDMQSIYLRYKIHQIQLTPD